MKTLLISFSLFAAVACLAATPGKSLPKVFVSGGNSFQISGGSGEDQVSGNAGPTVAEGIKLFQDRCPGVMINMRRDAADYIVSVTDDGSGAARKGRRAIVSKPNGDLLKAESDRSLKTAVEHACAAIEQDWDRR